MLTELDRCIVCRAALPSIRGAHLMRGLEACCKVEAGCAQAANFNRLKFWGIPASVPGKPATLCCIHQ